jgi:hypothetical protein
MRSEHNPPAGQCRSGDAGSISRFDSGAYSVCPVWRTNARRIVTVYYHVLISVRRRGWERGTRPKIQRVASLPRCLPLTTTAEGAPSLRLRSGQALAHVARAGEDGADAISVPF